MKDKKGVIDLFYVALFLFFLSLIVILSYSVFKPLQEDFTSDADYNRTEITNITTGAFSTTQGFFDSFDTLYIFVIVGLIVFLIGSALLIDAHPIALVPAILILAVFLFLVAVALSNPFEEITNDDSEIEQTTADYTFIPAIMSNLPFWIAVIAIIYFIILYGKQRLGGGSVV